MIKLTNILRLILLEDVEANKDISQGKLTEKYIEYIHKQIENYHSNNSVIRQIEDGRFDAVEINFDNLIVRISSNNSPQQHDASFQKGKGKNGKPIITVNKAEVKTNPLKVKFDETSFKHELKHYFDSKENSDDFEKNLKIQYKNNTSQGTVKDPDAYWNNPNEVNAYFFEHFMPEVLKFLKKEREIPDSFEEFQKDLLSNSGTRNFYHKINAENKKKVDKRLETYYKDILTNPDFKIEKDDNQIDNSKLEKSTYGFLRKLGDKLGLYQEE